MTINQAYEFCKDIANKDRSGVIPPSRFNLFALVAQQDAVAKRLRFLDQDQANLDELLPVLATKEEKLSPAGRMAFPPDYLRFSAAFRLDPVSKAVLAPLDLLTPAQFGKRGISRLKGPLDNYPIAKLEPGFLQVAPRKDFTVQFTYIRKYADPNWDYTLEDGEAVYNDTVTAGLTGKKSQGFVLAETAHIEICFRILQYIGVSLSHDTLLQYGLTQEKLR